MNLYRLVLWVECSPMVRETWVIPKTFKMVLDSSLLNTQQYKVEWTNPRKGVAPSPTSIMLTNKTLTQLPTSIEKEAFWSPSTTVTNFYTFIYIFTRKY